MSQGRICLKNRIINIGKRREELPWLMCILKIISSDPVIGYASSPWKITDCIIAKILISYSLRARYANDD